jgi:predicted nucleic acid-binding protein
VFRSAVLFDSGAFIALADGRDRHHGAATRFLRELPASIGRITTHAIAGESYTWLRYRRGAHAAAGWLDYLDRARAGKTMTIIYEDQRDGAAAEALLRRFGDQTLSYVDALSLVVARRYGAGAFFAFDQHLALTGLPVLPGPQGGPVP